MNRRQAVTLTLVAAFISGTLFAQRRPYDQLMKEIQTAYVSLNNGIGQSNTAAVAADAAKLQELFKDIEAFWTPFKTQDAIRDAKGAQEASAAIAVAVQAGDFQKAKALSAAVGGRCASCHASHREQMPDKSFRIKP